MFGGFQFQVRSIHRAKRDTRKAGRGVPRSSSGNKDKQYHLTGIYSEIFMFIDIADDFFADDTTAATPSTSAKVETTTWCDGGCVWDHMKVKAAQLGCSVYGKYLDTIQM